MRIAFTKSVPTGSMAEMTTRVIARVGSAQREASADSRNER